MVVEHVIPESLEKDPELLARTLKDFGLPDDFNLNDFGNWLPACTPCNLKKSAEPMRSTPIVQIELDRCRKKREEARRICENAVSDAQIGKAFAAIQRATEESRLSPNEIAPLISDFLSNNPEVSKIVNEALGTAKLSFGLNEKYLEVRLTDTDKAILSDAGLKLVHGAYGTGYVPHGEEMDFSFFCAHCGSLGPWNGARCMSCGHMDCGD